MIPIEAIRAVRTIVVHENGPGNACPDGTASAIILRDALPGARIVFASHGDPAFLGMRIEEGMLFCDLTPPRDNVQGVVAAGAIVLDHHEKQRDVVEAFGANGIYEDRPGLSGAWLAFEHVWRPLVTTATQETIERAAMFARLAGIRDTWQDHHESWEAACDQAEALRFWPWERLYAVASTYPFEKLSSLPGMMAIGPVLTEKRKIKSAADAASAFHFKTKRGHRVAVIANRETSDVVELLDVDVLVGFEFGCHPNGDPKVTLSLRSRGGYDVGTLAQFYGGGGHKAAAGLTTVGKAQTPYDMIRDLIDHHEQR